MGFMVLFDSKYLSKSVWVLFLLFIACSSSNELMDSASTNRPQTREEAEMYAAQIPIETSEDEKIIVTYRNHSSNIQISLDPKKDQFYMNLSGMTPMDKDSISVQDSSLIRTRAVDIQSLLSSFRKAQDQFYLGEYRNALDEIDKTLLIQETADAYALKGTIFFMLQNTTAAKANWNKAVQMDPNIPVPSIPELETLIEDIREEGN